MKRLYYLFTACVLLVLSSCGDMAREQLGKAAEQIDSRCPMNLGNGLSIGAVIYDRDENDITFSYISDESIVPVSSLRNAAGAQKAFMANYFSTESGNKFLELITKADAGMTLRYIGLVSNDTVFLSIPAQELKDMASGNNAPASEREQLQSIIDVTVAQCPVEMDGKDLVLNNVKAGQNNLEFYYSYNPEEYDFDNDVVRDALYESLCSELSAQATRRQLELMKALNLGVEYIMTPTDGGEPVIINYSSEQIAEI